MEKSSPRQKKVGVKREFSSGGVVFKNRTKPLFLISKSSNSKDYPKTWWRLQKGWIDDSDIEGIPGPISSGQIKASENDLQKTAIREVKEEGGVDAKIITKIGTEIFFFKAKSGGNVLKFVTFYLMEWKKDRDESYGNETSETIWLPYNEARNKLTHSGEKKILDKAKKILDSEIQNRLI